jgi:hypothetical protein
MKSDIENMTMTEKADAAFKQAALKVIERARQTGTPVILWENGRIVRRSWEELLSQPTKTPNQTHQSPIHRIREDETEIATDQARAETAREPVGRNGSIEADFSSAPLGAPEIAEGDLREGLVDQGSAMP